MTHGLLQDRLKVAQTQLLLANINTNVTASVVVTAIVFLMLRQQAYEPFLVPWCVAILAITVVRFFHLRRVRQYPLTAQNVAQTIKALSVLSVITGCVWGSLGLVYLSAENPTVSIIILMVYTGLVANASLTMASVLRIYLCFVIPILVPTAYKFYSLEEQGYFWISALVVVYMTVSFITTRRIRESLQQSNLLHLENSDLIEDLKIQNTKTEKALEGAEQANRAKSRFFAAASHDLRQPLQSISMFTTTLAAHTETSIQKKIVSQIDKSVGSLEGLFNALLDISSLDARTIKVRQQHFFIKPYMEELALEFASWTKENDLSFELAVDDAIVYTDPILLGRIVRNLVDNAVRYTDEGGVKLVATVKDERLQLSVIDTGIGIPTDKEGRIFEEFVQLNNPSRDRNKGLGLGLSIVQRICSLLDIHLSVDSNIAEGSRFDLALALGDANKVENQQPSRPDTSASLDGMFVLIVDDEEDVRVSMEGLLGVWGCTVMVASSGSEAVQQLTEYGIWPDVVITDYRLQDNETGADALAKIREHCNIEIPAIIITGDISPERLVEIDKLNLPVLHKPCRAARLLACLQLIYSTKDTQKKVSGTKHSG